MATAYKHEDDPPPQISVDLYANAPTPTTPLPGPRWYRVEWTTDQSLFANPAGRTAANFFPLGTAGINQSSLRKFTVPLDPAAWAQLKKARRLYRRIGEGTTQNTATWTWSPVNDYQVNHNPKAEAGAPQRVQLASGGTVATAVSLDASASTDPDPGSTLTKKWELKSPPAGFFDPVFLVDLESHLSQGGASPVPFPAATAVPRSGEGLYTFRLTVEDDDPPSLLYGRRGKDSAETTILVGSCLAGVCIDAPTGAQPAEQMRPDPISVSIEWSVEATLRQPGRKLRLSIATSGSAAPPVYVETDLLTSTTGTFVWPGTLSNGSPAPAGTYDLRLDLLDAASQPLTVAGFTTTATQVAAIKLDTFSVRINRYSTPVYWALNQQAWIDYEVHAPLPLDDLTLKLISVAGTTPVSIPPANLVGSIPYIFTAPGEIAATLEASRSSVVVASDSAEFFVLEDPLTSNKFAVGETFYDPTTDTGFVAVADRQLTLPAGDGYPAVVTVDIRALVRYPAVANGVGTAINPAFANYPLVLLVHGNHYATLGTGGAPVESYKGFEYLARHLARQGFIVASLDMDQLNGGFYPTINYRAETILAHIKRWQAKNASDPKFTGKVDLTRIGLVGHSRGGEAVVEANRIGAPAGTTIKGVVSMSPTDGLMNTHSGCPYLVVYGSADGDVINAHGFRLYDRAARPKAQVFAYGATHNDFVDHADWKSERDVGFFSSSFILPRPTVLDVARTYVNSFFQWSLLGRVEQTHFLNHGLSPQSLGTAYPSLECVRSFESDNFKSVDAFVTGAAALTDAGLPVITSGPVAPFDERSLAWTDVLLPPAPGTPWIVYDTCFFQQQTKGAFLGWTALAAYISGAATLDVRPYRFVSFRAAQALYGCSATPANVTPADARNPADALKQFRVGLKDKDGNFADIDLASFGQRLPYPYVRDDSPVSDPAPLPGRPAWLSPYTQQYAVHATKSAFATVHIPLWAFTLKEPKLKLDAIDQFQLLLDGTGVMAIDDIEFFR